MSGREGQVGHQVSKIKRVGKEPIRIYRWPCGDIEVDFGLSETVMTRRQAIKVANAILAATDTRGLRRAANMAAQESKETGQ